ncbi:MAG: four helix bundle protein [Patescibacteria group bacterium]
MKSAYLLWHQFYQTIPKVHRYSLAIRVDNLFVEGIEAVSTAVFLPKESKLPYIQLAIRKMDTLKVLLMILWEAGSLEDKKYVALSLPIDEVGKMLGGWFGQLAKSDFAKATPDKQNSPAKAGEK